MAEKSPHPFCKLCGANHPLGGPHAWDKPSGTKEQRLQIADAVLATKPASAPDGRGPVRNSRDSGGAGVSRTSRGRKSGAGSSVGEQRPFKPTVDGSIPSPPTKRTIADAATEIAALDNVLLDPAAVPKRRGRPSTGFDKKAYQRELMRKKRAAKKEAPNV